MYSLAPHSSACPIHFRLLPLLALLFTAGGPAAELLCNDIFADGFEVADAKLHVVNAVATSETEVVICFSRAIDIASVNSSGSQFAFDNGLYAVSATADLGNAVRVGTNVQSFGTLYVVTVDSSITDVNGAGLLGANTAMFTAY